MCGRKPPGRGYHQAWLRDSRLFIHGGFDGKEIYDDLYYVDLAACAYLPQITSFSVEVSRACANRVCARSLLSSLKRFPFFVICANPARRRVDALHIQVPAYMLNPRLGCGTRDDGEIRGTFRRNLLHHHDISSITHVYQLEEWLFNKLSHYSKLIVVFRPL